MGSSSASTLSFEDELVIYDIEMSFWRSRSRLFNFALCHEFLGSKEN